MKPCRKIINDLSTIFDLINNCSKIQKLSDPVHKNKPNPRRLKSYTSLNTELEHVQKKTLVFNVEETLLKSTSMFPFFMLVAFEGGGFIRAFVLLLLYPLLCLMVHEELKLRLMVFVCFIGIKRKTFRIGTTVLPKFFLENGGYQGFELIMKFGRRVGVSNMPRVMVEGFAKDYLGIDKIVGRELRVFGGHYVGLMETNQGKKDPLSKVLGEDYTSQVIAVAGTAKSFKKYTKFKEMYLVNEDDKAKWEYLPRIKYPKPLIFHDGRLAFLPTPFSSLVMFIWLPFGIVLCILRATIALLLPYNISIPTLAFLGISGKTTPRDHFAKELSHKTNNIVFVCNHKTLLDPIYLSFSCHNVPLIAVTYSISKMSQLLSPIKTVTLTRDRAKDIEIMVKTLNKGNIIVCPEGTTCREPYLLRFSPLFAEISDEIVPVALDVKVSMFHGTTASGIKALDPVFFLLNPCTYYFINYLEMLPKSHTCGVGRMSKVDVATHIQSAIGKALGYKCTQLTRKDKYIMLAGHNGSL